MCRTGMRASSRRPHGRQLARMRAGGRPARHIWPAPGRPRRQRPLRCIVAAPGARLCPNFRGRQCASLSCCSSWGGQGALLGVCVTFPDTAGCGSIFAVLGAFLLQRIALQGGGNRDSTLPTLSRSSCSPVRTGTVGAAIWRMCDWNISMRLLRPREWCCARQNSTWRSVLASEIRCSVETLQITAPGITCTQAMCAGVPKVIGDLLQLVWQRERRKSWLHSLLTAVHIGDCRVMTLNPKSAMQSD
jgi:hypothetical protein